MERNISSAAFLKFSFGEMGVRMQIVSIEIRGGIMMNTKSVDYLGGKLFPMILRFSIPAAVSLLITAVYNIVDRY